MSVWSDGLDLPEPWGVRDNPALMGAFSGLLSFLWSEPGAQAAFCLASGHKPFVGPAEDPLSALVDAACGLDRERDLYCRDFIAWAIREHWGEEDAVALAEGQAPRPTERESSRDSSLPLEPNTLREEGAAQSKPCTDAGTHIPRSHEEQSFDGKERA